MDTETPSTAEVRRTMETSVRDRVRAEYDEMPGLCLTLAQAARFWQLDHDRCASALDELVRDGYLVRRRSGYVRSR